MCDGNVTWGVAWRSQGKANFFERRVGEYQRAGVRSAGLQPMSRDPSEYVFTTEADF